MKSVEHVLEFTGTLRAVLFFLMMFSLAASQSVFARDILISEGANLSEIVLQSEPGDVVLLESGDYSLRIDEELFSSEGEKPVTLRSADIKNPARIVTLGLFDTGNMVIEDLVLDYRYNEKRAERNAVDFLLARTHDVIFRRVLFDGDTPSEDSKHKSGHGYGIGRGVFIRWSRNVTIEDSTFRNYSVGIDVNESTHVTLRNSDIYNMSLDGSNFAGVQDILIEGNYFHAPRKPSASKGHSDMIQFWTRNTSKQPQNITIKDNIINADGGYWSQSIFMRNEKVDSQGAGHEYYYKNVQITGNVILNDHIHGITLGESEDVFISRNTLARSFNALGLSEGNSRMITPGINVRDTSEHVVITDNLAGIISGNKYKVGWISMNNVLIDWKSKAKPTSYEKVFVSPGYNGKGGLRGYVYRKYGSLKNRNIGSPLLKLGVLNSFFKKTGAPSKLIDGFDDFQRSNPQYLIPGLEPKKLIKVIRHKGTANSFKFVAHDEAKGLKDYVWYLEGENGEELQSIQAQAVEAAFPVNTWYFVHLEMPDGEKDSVEINVPPSDVLRIKDGTIFYHDNGDLEFPNLKYYRIGSGEDIEDLTGPTSIVLAVSDRARVVSEFPSEMFEFLKDARKISIHFKMRVIPGLRDPGGVVIDMPDNFLVVLTTVGGIRVSFRPEGLGGNVTLATPPAHLNDGNWHEVKIEYDVDLELAKVLVDKKIRASKPVKGELFKSEVPPLILSSSKSQKPADLFISELSILIDNGQIMKTGDHIQLTPTHK